MGWLLGGLAAFALVFMSSMVGLYSQSWAPFWFAGSNAAPVAGRSLGEPVAGPAPDPGNLAPLSGFVSDSQRYQLARFVGWNAADAVIAVAISIAENGSGNPAALSGTNRDGSRDLGLWQVNSGWWPQFGGAQALSQPLNNARAAFAIYGRQHWCAWSTYLASCGPGHTGSYASFLSRARAAAQVQSPAGEA